MFAVAGIVALALAASSKTDSRIAAVVAALQEHLRNRGHEGLGPDSRFAIGFDDLNGDKRDEAVLYVSDSRLCGSGGCTSFVFTPVRAGNWSWVGSITLTHLPIYRLATKHHGWHDIGVTVRADYVDGGFAAVPFAGSRYSLNPTVAPSTPARGGGAELVISEDAQLQLFPGTN